MLRWFTKSALALVLMTPAACASRSVPQKFSESSPASSAAAEVSATPVTLSLRGDPPLPGTPAPGWTGLKERESAEEDPHAHHHNQAEAVDASAPAPSGGSPHAH